MVEKWGKGEFQGHSTSRFIRPLIPCMCYSASHFSTFFIKKQKQIKKQNHNVKAVNGVRPMYAYKPPSRTHSNSSSQRCNSHYLWKLVPTSLRTLVHDSSWLLTHPTSTDSLQASPVERVWEESTWLRSYLAFIVSHDFSTSQQTAKEGLQLLHEVSYDVLLSLKLGIECCV